MNRKDKRYKYLIVLLLVCIFGIGYAALVSNLNIDGYATFRGSAFDVHFENIIVTNGSVEINTTAGDSAATIEPTNKTRVDYSITLEEPGDFYEFTVDVVNDGTIDAMISLVTSKMNGTEITTLPNYLEYNVTYVDGVEIEQNHELNATQTETYKVRVAFRDDINPSDLPTTTSTLNFSFGVQYVQRSSNAIAKPTNSSFIYTTSIMSQRIGDPFNTTSSPDPETAMSTYGHNFFLRHKVENNNITESYAGFKVGGTTYYIRGAGATYNEQGMDEQGVYYNYDSPYYSTNVSTLLSAFESFNCNDYENDGYIECSIGHLYAIAYPYGYLYVADNYTRCGISEDSYSSCG